MAFPASEVCYLTLKPNTDIETSTPEAKIWQACLKTIASQDGFQELCALKTRASTSYCNVQSQHWGRQMEHPDVVALVVDWTSKEKHDKFISSPAYGPMTSSLTFALDVNFHHVTFTPHPPRILQEAPCTEFATFYSTEEGFFENIEKFRKALDEGKPDGYYGSASGSVLEELRREGKDDNGQAVTLFLGWESKEAHIKFRDTKLFEENIGLLREKHGGVTMVHVLFKTYE